MTWQILCCSFSEREAGIRAVRQRVFIEEQGIDPDEEWDAQDAGAVFAIALNEQDEIIGTARLLDSGRIGRMAVLPEYRRQGIASALLQALIEIARQRGHRQIKLSAQQAIMGLYQKQGFSPVGPAHEEVGIAHQNMQRDF